MPSPRLTAKTVANAKPPARGRIEYWDAALPGFGLRVTEKGAKSWTVLYRVHDRQRRSTLGSYPTVPLAEARERARDVLREVDKGNDPAALKAEEHRREAAVIGPPVSAFLAANSLNDDGAKSPTLLLASLAQPVLPEHPLGIDIPDPRRTGAQLVDLLAGFDDCHAGRKGDTRAARRGVGDDRADLVLVDP